MLTPSLRDWIFLEEASDESRIEVSANLYDLAIRAVAVFKSLEDIANTVKRNSHLVFLVFSQSGG